MSLANSIDGGEYIIDVGREVPRSPRWFARGLSAKGEEFSSGDGTGESLSTICVCVWPLEEDLEKDCTESLERFPRAAAFKLWEKFRSRPMLSVVYGSCGL